MLTTTISGFLPRWVVVASLASGLGAAAQQNGDIVTRSQSGQFYVHAMAGAAPRRPASSGSTVATPYGQLHVLPSTRPLRNLDAAELGLDSPLVILACERVKQALLKTLGLPDDWKSEIHIFLNPGIQGEQTPVNALPTIHGWLYRVSLPPRMKEMNLDRLIVHLILIERANRNGGPMVNNVPKWLSEGLARCLRDADPESLSIERISMAESRFPLEVTLRPQFARTQPLSFDELSWPENLDSEKYAVFYPSSQLFVHELLNLPDGHACLAKMIQASPNYLNWQFAFLNAFQSQFHRLLDVEKWWSVTWVHLLGQNPHFAWSDAAAWSKFEASILVTMAVQTNSARLPARRAIRLQEAIRRLKVADQEAALEMSLMQLRLVQTHATKRIADLVVEYQKIISEYLGKVGRAGQNSVPPNRAPINLNVLRESTCGKLDMLDQKRVKTRGVFNLESESASIQP
jgi:hypothetical protein